MRAALILACASVAFAGQSVPLTSGQQSSAGVDPPSSPCCASFWDLHNSRVEVQLHNFGATPSVPRTGIISLQGTGINIFLDNTGLVEVEDVRDSDGGATCRFPVAPYPNMLLRIQRNILSGTPNVTCEAWNWDGTNYQNSTFPISLMGWIFGTAILGDSSGAQTNVDVGFLNVFTSLVAMNTTPPVTSARGDYTALTFDTSNYNSGTGVFADLSGNGHTITWLTGQTMVATPNQVPVALANTFNLPTSLASVTEAIPFRAGTNGQMDGTRSYSLADASSTVTYQWRVTPPAGAPDPCWSSHTTAQPTIGCTTFGDYLFQLTATDVNNSTATTTLHVGAVATDLNGVVVDAQQAFSDAVFGQQCLYGAVTCNPFPYMDWANMNDANIVGAQIGGPTSGLPISDDWNNPLAGTCFITGTAPNLTVTCSGFNTQTVFGGGGTKWKWNGWLASTAYAVNDFAVDSQGNFEKVTGCVSSCMTGSSAPSWPAFPSTGAMTTDNNVTWTSQGAATMAQYPIIWYNDPNNTSPQRVGRLPLGITGVPTSTTISINTTNDPWPYLGTSCTSSGAVPLGPCQLASSANWVNCISGVSSCGYYDGGTMFEALHRRTGLDQYGVMANTLAHITNTAPNIDQGVEFHILPRVNTSRQWAVNQVYHPTSSYFSELQFALRHVAGAVSHYLVLPGNPAGPVSQNINGTKVDCLPLCPTDVREVGAAGMNLSAAAYVETDPTWQTTLNGYIESAYTKVWGPLQQSDGHWDQTVGGSPPAGMGLGSFTNGSPVVTGTFTSTACGTVDTTAGTIQITANGTTILGTSTAFSSGNEGDYLVIYGTRSGVYAKFFSFIPVGGYTSSTQITSNYPINLDSASGLHYSLWKPIGSQPAMGAVKTDSMENVVSYLPSLTNWYTCTYNNGSQITLDMNFADWTTTGGNQFGYLFAQPVGGDGYVTTQGNQPYMNSFPAAALRLGGLVGTTNAANMLTASKALYPFLSGINSWTGIPTLGFYFSSIFANCQPPYPAGICGGSTQNLREFGLEVHKALSDAYLSAPTTPGLAFANAVACAAWGNAAYDSLPCSDSGHVQDSGSGFTSASPWKFAYQPFALGNNASLPAAIIGGLAPSLPRTVQVAFKLGTADHMTASVQAPTGAPPVVITCTVSPCAISVDDRTSPGSYFLTETFYNSGGGVVAQGSAQQIR